MTGPAFNVLFLCTGNSARSILAEALVNHWGQGRFRGFSAGSYPKGAVHPFALRLLQTLDLPTEGLHSKSWDVFAGSGALVMDFVFSACSTITAPSDGVEQALSSCFARQLCWRADALICQRCLAVCHQAAGEICPVWPGQPITAHWGMPDPAAVDGPDVEKWQAFRDAFCGLEHRIRAFFALPVASLDRMTLIRQARAIGQMPPPTMRDVAYEDGETVMSRVTVTDRGACHE